MTVGSTMAPRSFFSDRSGTLGAPVIEVRRAGPTTDARRRYPGVRFFVRSGSWPAEVGQCPWQKAGEECLTGQEHAPRRARRVSFAGIRNSQARGRFGWAPRHPPESRERMR